MNYRLKLPDGFQKHPLPGRDEWTAALRSGEYSKTSAGKLCATLASSTCYCCLGVLCDLQGSLLEDDLCGVDVLDSWGDDQRCAEGLSTSNPMERFLSLLGEFPDDVEVVVTISGAYGPVEISFTDLASLNDSSYSTFAMIANVIDDLWYNDGPLPIKQP